MLLRAAFPYVALSWLGSLAFLATFVPAMAMFGKDPASAATALAGGTVAFLALGVATIGCHLFGDAPTGR